MKNPYLIIFITLVPIFMVSQVKGVVLDSISNEKIPYVNIWIENTKIGTTSNEDGTFKLETTGSVRTLVFSAIGYKTKRINSDLTQVFFYLKPKISELDEVVIKVKKDTKEKRIEIFKKRKIHSAWAASPSIVAKLFKHKKEYDKTPFLKTVKVLTRCRIKKGKFLLHIYAVNDKNEPGELLHDENILVTAKKGKKNTEIDVSKLNIQFPKNGLYIGLNSLKIESNKYEFTVTSLENNKVNMVFYEPTFGITYSKEKSNDKLMRNGKVSDISKMKLTHKKNVKHTTLAIELVLSN